MNNNNICIVSGRYPESSFHSFVNHKIYAAIHGYSFIYCNWPTKSINPYLNKIHYINEYIDHFEYIFWIDDDAFFIDMSISLREFIPQNEAFLSICESPKYKKNFTSISSGQFFIKSTPLAKKFINDILSLDMKIVETWWKQEYGMFTNGDQDKIFYLMNQKNGYRDNYQLYDYKRFNSRIENIKNIEEHNIFILHLTGDKKTKKKSLKEAQKILNMNKYLVKQDIISEYCIEKSILHRVLRKLKGLYEKII